MVMLPAAFYSDSMFKYKTGFLGAFIKKDSVAEDAAAFGMHWFALKPNHKLINPHYYKGGLSLDDERASHYVMADSNLYINAQDGKLTEIPLFAKKK